jgi:hypothetical protein
MPVLLRHATISTCSRREIQRNHCNHDDFRRFSCKSVQLCGTLSGSANLRRLSPEQ